MSQYRDEASAARLRIETLEAQMAERDASLRAREAELREAEHTIASQTVDEDERERREARRALAAGQAAFLGVMVCLVVCATIFPLLWGASVKRPAPLAPAAPAARAPLMDRGAWGRATDEELRSMATVCQRVGDVACAEAVADLQRARSAQGAASAAR